MSETLRDWYRGRRILITGHTGFKGSWLAAWLRDAGAAVSGYALAPDADRPSLFTTARIDDGIESVIADVRDRDALGAAVARANPEIVFHLAAQSLVRRSYSDPVGTFGTNVQGTVHLLDALRRAPAVRAVVVVTSDKCYEIRDFARGYREDDPMGGHDPYSASKGAQELITAAYRRSFLGPAGVAVATARAGNVIGGGDWSDDRLIADLMRAAYAGGRAAIRNPASVRPWQFVLEPLRGYLMLGRALRERPTDFSEGWNFGPDLGDAVPVRELVERVTAAWPRVVAEMAPDVSAPHEAAILRLDNGKARARLGWTPVLSLAESVTLTVTWYRAAHERPSSAPDMVRQQLADYERRVAAAAAPH